MSTVCWKIRPHSRHSIQNNMIIISSLLRCPPDRRRWLIASSEARFNRRSCLTKEVIPERALSLITHPNQNPTLHHQTAPQTINSHTHPNQPPYKKPLISFSLSYLGVEREKEMNDAPIPLRRPINEVRFKRHDSLRGEMLNHSGVSERSGLIFTGLIRRSDFKISLKRFSI